MATLTIHNISDDLLEKLERSAIERGLSVEDEAVRRILSTKFALNERERVLWKVSARTGAKWRKKASG